MNTIVGRYIPFVLIVLFYAVPSFSNRFDAERLIQAVRSCNIEEAKKLIDAGADINWQPRWDEPALLCIKCNDCYRSDNPETGKKTVEMLRLLIARGVNVRARDGDGRTALMIYAPCSHEAARVLLEAGADVRARDNDGNTVLHRAIFDVETMKMLVKAGGDINARSKQGYTPLMSYVTLSSSDSLAAAQAMISLGADVNRPDNEDCTPLMFAASNGLKDMTELLLRNGARHGAKNRVDGNSALHFAAFSGNGECVTALLAAGADPNAQNIGRITPLMIAEGRGNRDAARIIREAGGIMTQARTTGPFGLAMAWQTSNGMDRRYDNYEDYWMACAVERQDCDGVLARMKGGIRPSRRSLCEILVMAAALDNLALIEAALAAGAEIDGKYMGPTALHVAWSNNNVRAMKKLLDHGADPCSARTMQSIMHFHITTADTPRKGDAIMAGAAGYDPVCLARTRALYNAVARGDCVAAEKAIDDGADPDESPVREDCPLYAAIRAGNASMVRTLLDHGADACIDRHRSIGRSPLTVLFTVTPYVRGGLADQTGNPQKPRLTAIADMLIDDGADVNELASRSSMLGITWYYDTPLPGLVRRRMQKEARHLLSRGAGVDIFNEPGFYAENYTSLIFACRNVDPDMARTLLAAGADVNRKNSAGKTAFHHLASVGPCGYPTIRDACDEEDEKYPAGLKSYAELVDMLLKAGGDINARDMQGRTPLMIAASCNNGGGVKCLLEKGADYRAKDAAGWTAVTHAAGRSDPSIVEFLLKAGADPLSAGTDGVTPLAAAIAGRNNGVALLLKKAGVRDVKVSGGFALISAIRNDDRMAMEGMDLSRVAVNTKDRYGYSPLMYAIICRNAEMARRLIAAGADVNARAPDGSTPLIMLATDPWVTWPEHPGRLWVDLIRAGADVKARDRAGRTALMAAMWIGHYDMADGLIAAGASVNEKNNEGMTPMMYLAIKSIWMNKDRNYIRAFVKKGADINESSKNGMTPLMFAVLRGDYDDVKAFLYAGADPEKKTVRGTMAADLALVMGESAVASLLLKWMKPSAKQRLALAAIYRQEGRYKLAEREIEKALSIEKSAAAYNQLAILHVRWRDGLSALEAVRKGIELDPGNAALLYNGACAWSLRGNAGEACKWLNRAVDAGFRDRKKLLRDPDLRSIRESGAFKNVLDRVDMAK